MRARNIWGARVWAALLLGMVVALMLPALARAQAPAGGTKKLIAIVHDTSGSMAGTNDLPAFAVNTLLATLDGTGRDRAFLYTFTEFEAGRGPQPIALGQQAGLDRAYGLMANTAANTPYPPLEIILDLIAREAKPDEDIHLIYVTDGDITVSLPPAARVRQSLEALQARIAGKVTVSHILIVPDPRISNASRDRGRQLRAGVRQQGVRAALLEVFNGKAGVGQYEVEGAAQLWTALKAIIAQIAATDHTAQRQFLEFEARSIRIETPFSIKRIVSVATDPAGGTPPQIEAGGTSFQTSGASPLRTRMAQGDGDYPGVNFNAEVNTLRFVPGLAPGDHVIAFDRDIGDNVFLLFDTSAVVDVKIIDPDTGAELQRDGQGRYALVPGKDYHIAAYISDGGTNASVGIDSLPPGTTFSAVVAAQGAEDNLPLRPDTGLGYAYNTFVAEADVDYTVTARVVMPGFVSPRSAPVKLFATSKQVSLQVIGDTPAEDCAACAPDEVTTTLVPGGGAAAISTVMVEIASPSPITLSVGVDTGDVSLDLEAGSLGRLADGDTISLPAGTHQVPFAIARPGVLAGTTLQQGAFDFGLTLTPTGGSEGAALEIDRRIKVIVPDAHLELRAYSKGDISGSLGVSGLELYNDSTAAYFELSGIVADPQEGRFGSGVSGFFSRWINLEIVEQDRVVTATPSTSYWCLCYIGLETMATGHKRSVDVTYAGPLGLQQAQSGFDLEITVAGKTLVLSCLLNLLYALLAYWFIRWLLAWIGAHRFPKDATAVVTASKRDLPQFYPLRGRNYTPLKALLAPFGRTAHEVTNVRGLRFQATRDGAAILLDKRQVPPWRHGGLAQTFAEICEFDPKARSIPILWGESLENLQTRGYTIELLRDDR